MKNTKILSLLFLLIFSSQTWASILSKDEQGAIASKLGQIPKTREAIWNILFPKNNRPKLSPDFQNELEGILKTALLEADTQVVMLTPNIRNELKVDNTIAAFHQQGNILFNILPSHSGRIQSEKQNEKVRKLKSAKYFTHAHNVFVADEEISSNINTVILLFHELSHAAFDEMLTRFPVNLTSRVQELISPDNLNKLIAFTNGKVSIDGDLYDLFSERYAFELEFRIDRRFAEVVDAWPAFYRFNGVNEDEYVDLLDGFVRRVYNIDHPLLDGARAYPLDNLILH